jgi:putative endonuclease
MEEHRNKIVKGFTEKYNLTQLVYYEIHDDIHAAAHRERLMKKWKREWKIELIEKKNPHWADLHADLKRKAV